MLVTISLLSVMLVGRILLLALMLPLSGLIMSGRWCHRLLLCRRKLLLHVLRHRRKGLMGVACRRSLRGLRRLLLRPLSFRGTWRRCDYRRGVTQRVDFAEFLQFSLRSS